MWFPRLAHGSLRSNAVRARVVFAGGQHHADLSSLLSQWRRSRHVLQASRCRYGRGGANGGSPVCEALRRRSLAARSQDRAARADGEIGRPICVSEPGSFATIKSHMRYLAGTSTEEDIRMKKAL